MCVCVRALLFLHPDIMASKSINHMVYITVQVLPPSFPVLQEFLKRMTLKLLLPPQNQSIHHP